MGKQVVYNLGKAQHAYLRDPGGEGLFDWFGVDFQPPDDTRGLQRLDSLLDFFVLCDFVVKQLEGRVLAVVSVLVNKVTQRGLQILFPQILERRVLRFELQTRVFVFQHHGLYAGHSVHDPDVLLKLQRVRAFPDIQTFHKRPDVRESRDPFGEVLPCARVFRVALIVKK